MRRPFVEEGTPEPARHGISLITAADQQPVRLEWRFKGLTFGFPVLGAYIDDVVVSENP